MNSPVIQKDDYYPFGMTFNSWQRDEDGLKNDYLYNGKEMQDELNLGWMDYGARMYDGAIGRWHVVDPLSEKLNHQSPYAYVNNNPLLFNDPTGMIGELFDKNGNHIGTDNQDDGKVFIVTDKDVAKDLKSGDGVVEDASQVSSAYEIKGGLNTLDEIENVIERTLDNGGMSEESSLVMNDGSVVRGSTGDEASIVTNQYGTRFLKAGVTVPDLPEGSTTSDVAVSIHSHVLDVKLDGGQVFSHTAMQPSGGVDQITFNQFSSNVIVGRDRLASAKTSNGKTEISQGNIGAAFYRGSRVNNPKFLSRRAMKKIAKSLR